MSSTYLDFALQMATFANKQINDNLRTSKDIEIKGDESPVTTIDKAINHELINRSAQYFPDFGVLGEEESSIHAQTEFTWVCDPIDGTIPFILGMPTSTFSLALCHNGIPIVSVISHPFTNTHIKAEIHHGAFDEQNNRLSVNKKSLSESMSVISVDWWKGSEFEFGDVYKNLTQVERAYIITPGSACYAAMMVARGSFTAAVFAGSKGKCVDMAAASLLVKEAGGMATDFYGNDQRYDQDIRGCLLSNGLIHQTILQYLPTPIATL